MDEHQEMRQERERTIYILRGPWWLLILRGLALVVFGGMAVGWPDITLSALIIVFGAFVLVEGVFAVGGSLADLYRSRQMSWSTLIAGIISILVGVVTFAWPEITGLALLYVIAAWVLIVGIITMATAIQLRREVSGSGILILGGFISVGIGVALFAWPLAGALTIVWLIGVYAIIFGILLFISGLMSRAPEVLEAQA
jgi:uncharacterized membrane protein HdeD (DUF308 family)